MPRFRTSSLLPALLALGVAGCGSARAGGGATPVPEHPAAPPPSATTPPPPAPHPRAERVRVLALTVEAESRVEQVRATYHAGLERVLAAAASDPRTSTYWPLRGLAEFWRGSVAWVESPDAALPQPDSGRARRGWLAVVPPGGGSRAGSPDALELARHGGAPVIRIRPEQVTEVWAGLFLVHELAHLADRVLWGEAEPESRHAYLQAELRAAELELAAATAVSGGRLLPRLDRALDRLAPRSVTELVDRTRRLEDWQLVDLAPPELALPAASATERSMRSSFYRTALVLRYAGRQDLDLEVLLLGLDTLLLADD